MTLRLLLLSAALASAFSARNAQPQFDLPISGTPIRPLRQPAGFSSAPDARQAFRPAVTTTRPSVACGVRQSSAPSRFDIPPFTAHDTKSAPNVPAGQQDISLYVDSTGTLTYAIELRASRPFLRGPSGSTAGLSESARVAYRTATAFTVVETDFVNHRLRAFNVVGGEYQRGIEGPLEELDALVSLEQPRARAEAALTLCRRAVRTP